MKTLNPAMTAAAILIISAPLALAQTTSGSTTTGSALGNAAATTPATGSAMGSNQPGTQLSQTDRQFLSECARGSRFEMQASELAQQKAQNQQIKQYAAMIVSDHSKYNDALQQLARESGATLPDQMSEQDQTRFKKLQSLSGTAFDRQYVEDMRQVNQQDKTQAQKEASNTRSQQVKQFIEQFRQTDQKHLADAQQLPTNS